MGECLQAEHDWGELMKMRNAATEQMSSTKVDKVRMEVLQQIPPLSLSKLCKYEEKIGMKEIFLKHGVPQPKLFLALRPPWSDVQLEAAIREGILAVGAFVVKPSHLTTGQSVFSVDKHLTGRLVQPVGPGRQVMEEAAGKSAMTKFSISAMESKLQEAMRQNAGAREVKPLRECSRGVVVEEMVDQDGELRVLVLHDRGVEVWRGKDGKWEFSEEEGLQLEVQG